MEQFASLQDPEIPFQSAIAIGMIAGGILGIIDDIIVCIAFKIASRRSDGNKSDQTEPSKISEKNSNWK